MKTYLKQASPDERKALAKAVASSVGYFYLIGGRHKKPGTGLCQKLVQAEPRLTLSELRPDIWPELAASPDAPPATVTQHNTTGETA